MLANGRKRYMEISDGGTTVRWTKDCYRNFVEYYKLVDKDMVRKMESDYNALTYKAMTFMIVEDMCKARLKASPTNDDNCLNAQIARIVGTSESSVRTMRARINKKKRD